MYDAMGHPATLLKLLDGSLFPPSASPPNTLQVTWHELVFADGEPEIHEEEGYVLCKVIPSGRSVTIPNPDLLPCAGLSAEENARRMNAAAALARKEAGLKNGAG